MHVSARVQASLSLQAVPSGASGSEQSPVAVSHTPATWQGSLGAQRIGSAPTHAPAWQASWRVQALPSTHGVSFGAAGFEQRPLSGSQAPALWH